jgi:hypothetical protein
MCQHPPPRFLLHLPHPVTANRAPLSPGPACWPLAPVSPVTRRPPLSRNCAAARARWPGAAPRCRPCHRTPSPSSCPMRHRADPLLLFPLAARTLERPQKPSVADLAPLHLHFSSPSAPCAAASQLPSKPVWAVLRSPHHRESGPPRASIFSILGESVLHASWLPIGVCLTLSLLIWHCRTTPPTPPITGAPPPPLDIAMLPPLRPHTSSRCLGEPSPPPSRQACCHRPHGARTTVPKTPCPPEHVDQPRHPVAARVATAQ